MFAARDILALVCVATVACSTTVPATIATDADGSASDAIPEATTTCTCVAGHPDAVCPDGAPQPYLGQACDLAGSCFDLWAPCPNADAGPAPTPCSIHECGTPDAHPYVCADRSIAGPLCGRDAKGFCEWTLATCPDAGGE